MNSFSEKYGYVGPPTETFERRLKELVQLLVRFDEAPFTIQRLAELLLEHNGQYVSTYKLMNGFEKILSVSSSAQSFCSQATCVMDVDGPTNIEVHPIESETANHINLEQPQEV